MKIQTLVVDPCTRNNPTPFPKVAALVDSRMTCTAALDDTEVPAVLEQCLYTASRGRFSSMSEALEYINERKP